MIITLPFLILSCERLNYPKKKLSCDQTKNSSFQFPRGFGIKSAHIFLENVGTPTSRDYVEFPHISLLEIVRVLPTATPSPPLLYSEPAMKRESLPR